MLKKMRPLVYLLLMAVTVALTSCGPALGNNGEVKSENITFKGSVMGHSVYLAELPSGSSIYFIDDDNGEGMALARLGKYPDYIVQANGASDLKSLSTEDLIARRTTLQTELDATDNEINRRAEALQEQVNALKKKD